MFLHDHLSNIFFSAHVFTQENHLLEQCSHHRLVAVDKGKNYTSLVYCDPFYELVL